MRRFRPIDAPVADGYSEPSHRLRAESPTAGSAEGPDDHAAPESMESTTALDVRAALI